MNMLNLYDWEFCKLLFSKKCERCKKHLPVGMYGFKQHALFWHFLCIQCRYKHYPTIIHPKQEHVAVDKSELFKTPSTKSKRESKPSFRDDHRTYQFILQYANDNRCSACNKRLQHGFTVNAQKIDDRWVYQCYPGCNATTYGERMVGKPSANQYADATTSINTYNSHQDGFITEKMRQYENNGMFSPANMPITQPLQPNINTHSTVTPTHNSSQQTTSLHLTPYQITSSYDAYNSPHHPMRKMSCHPQHEVKEMIEPDGDEFDEEILRWAEQVETAFYQEQQSPQPYKTTTNDIPKNNILTSPSKVIISENLFTLGKRLREEDNCNLFD